MGREDLHIKAGFERSARAARSETWAELWTCAERSYCHRLTGDCHRLPQPAIACHRLPLTDRFRHGFRADGDSSVCELPMENSGTKF